jgi:hypothetical protein
MPLGTPPRLDDAPVEFCLRAMGFPIERLVFSLTDLELPHRVMSQHCLNPIATVHIGPVETGR